ncbi:MAG: hypothetical protein IJR99_00665 [Kiritimatiellae bacterium]|nr:hypothetical protein [Kiritimatiellia bacterium]
MKKHPYPGANDVFVQNERDSAQMEFQFSRMDEEELARPSHRLFRYIFAGGLRQTRRTTADDVAERRRRTFLVGVAVLCVVWVIFYFLPCE